MLNENVEKFMQLIMAAYPHNTLHWAQSTFQAVANMHAARVVKSYMEANISIEEIRSTLENQFLSNAVHFGHSTANAANLLAHCDIQANAAILRRLKRGFNCNPFKLGI